MLQPVFFFLFFFHILFYFGGGSSLGVLVTSAAEWCQWYYGVFLVSHQPPPSGEGGFRVVVAVWWVFVSILILAVLISCSPLYHRWFLFHVSPFLFLRGSQNVLSFYVAPRSGASHWVLGRRDIVSRFLGWGRWYPVFEVTRPSRVSARARAARALLRSGDLGSM